MASPAPNTRPPIFRLSKEITLNIFALCGPPAYAADMASSDEWDDGWDPDDPARCLAVSHVCQLWRAYALDDPLLWTEPLLEFPALARMMLTRVRAAGLVIRYPTHNYDECNVPFPASLYASLRNFAQVHRLDLCAGENGLSDFFLNFAAPAPNLRTVTIDVHPDDGIWRMPSHVFDSLSPLSSLRELFCHRCLPPSQTRILGHLTTLKLDFDYDDTRWEDSYMDAIYDDFNSVDSQIVFSILHSAHSLQHLSIMRVIKSPPEGLLSVTLPHLQTFRVLENRHVIGHLLSHISLPATARLDLHCAIPEENEVEENSPGNNANAFLKSVRNWLRAKGCPPPLCVVIQHRMSDCVMTVTGPPSLSLRWTEYFAPFPHILRHSLASLPLHSITFLELSATYAYMSSHDQADRDFIAALRQVPQVAQLSLTQVPALVKPLLEALAHSDFHRTSRSLRVLVPELCKVRIANSKIWVAESDKTLAGGSMARLLGQRLVNTGKKLGLLEIDESSGVVLLAGKKAAERTVRLLRVAERVVTPHSPDDGAASEDV
jgi:hypothetical protein